MKNFYAEIAAHALRCWARGHEPTDEAGALCNQACIRAIKDLPAGDIKMIKTIYASKLPFSRSVQNYSLDSGIPEGRIWDKIRVIEKRVAKERGLL